MVLGIKSSSESPFVHLALEGANVHIGLPWLKGICATPSGGGPVPQSDDRDVAVHKVFLTPGQVRSLDKHCSSRSLVVGSA